MKHFGNFVALLIVAVNALFTGLFAVGGIQSLHPTGNASGTILSRTDLSGLCTYQRRLSDFLAGYTTIQDSFAAVNRPSVMLLAATDYLPLNFHTTELPEGSIKLLSYNIMGFDGAYKKDGKNPILTYLKESNADILCLQEYASDESPRHLTQKDIERELKDYPYRRINVVGSGSGYTNRIACYSRFPILSATCPGLCKQLQRFRTV